MGSFVMLLYNIERMLSATFEFGCNSIFKRVREWEWICVCVYVCMWDKSGLKEWEEWKRWIGTTCGSRKSIVQVLCTHYRIRVAETQRIHIYIYWSILDICANWNEIKSQQKTSNLPCI